MQRNKIAGIILSLTYQIFMKKVILLFFAVCLLMQVTHAQDNRYQTNPDATNASKEKVPLKDRLFFGGDLGLSFGTVTYVNLAPIVGYKFTQKFGAGIGPSYAYVKDSRQGAAYSASSYGGRIFAQYKVIEQAVAYTEYSVVNADAFDEFKYQWVRVNIPSFLVGGGYIEPIGRSSSFMLMVLWDLEGSRFSYTQNPIIRGGFNIGF